MAKYSVRCDCSRERKVFVGNLELFFARIPVGFEMISAELYLTAMQYYTRRSGPKGPRFDKSSVWYAECYYSRTVEETPDILRLRRPDVPIIKSTRTFRNPLVVAMELQYELVRDNLTRKQLAERYGISSDRVTQWLCLLKLPEEKQREIESLGDYWDRQIVTERELRRHR